MVAEDRTVEPCGEVTPRFVNIGRDLAGHRKEGNQRPVADEQGDGQQLEGADPAVDHEQRDDQVADGDPLQHARDAPHREQLGERPGTEEPERKAGQEQPEPEQDQRPPQDLQVKGAQRYPCVDAALEREHDRDADDEQEEGEDEIRRRPAVPSGVLERPVVA
jgi:hypothetical protein